MRLFIVPLSIGLIFVVLWDGFESVVLPRRVTRPYRYARLYYRLSWALWRTLACRLAPGKRRETFLSYFGPLSLLGLFATWFLGLIVGFASLNWSLGTELHTPEATTSGFGAYLYLSGVTFFTLGYGDVFPAAGVGRFLAVIEAGLGFAFLALVIGYLPVLFQAVSQREITISLLDARAGSPPTAGQLLLRLGHAGNLARVDALLSEWERWAAQLLESHLSYPVLSFYRSQHDNQSWLAALTVVLDTCALLIAGVKGVSAYQAQLTFAMARHAAVDLALVFKTEPVSPEPERLSAGRLDELRKLLHGVGVVVAEGAAVDAKLAELRAMYEPFVNALAQRFLFMLPPILPESATADNWQTSAWTQRTPGIGRLADADAKADHFS